MRASTAQLLIGRRIEAVVAANAATTRDGIGSQLFLVFEDGSSLELYGQPIPAKGLRPGGIEAAVAYARACSATEIHVFDSTGTREHDASSAGRR